MTLVFPPTPFSGTDSFESAYKALAESIWDDLQNLKIDKSPYAAFYRDHNVMKELLQSGLKYSSFIIQQRSGGGVGSDFNVGSSPALITLNRDYLKLLGCSFIPQCMMSAWMGTVFANPEEYPELIKYGSNEFGAMWDLVYAIVDDDIDRYMDTYENLGVQRNGIQSALLNAWNFAMALPGLPTSLGLSGILLSNYLNGTGDTFSETSLTAQQLSNLEAEINLWLDSAEGKTYKDKNGNDIPHVKDVTTPDLLNTYGGDSTDKVVMVNFKYGSGDSLHTAFGRATLVTDSSGNVKKVIDDYDFYMGWEVDRTADGSAPGSPISDDIVVTGSGRRSGDGLYDSNGDLNNLIGGINAEDAYSSGNAIESWLLMTVSGSYGNGAYESYTDHPGAPGDKGRPFPVNITFP